MLLIIKGRRYLFTFLTNKNHLCWTNIISQRWCSSRSENLDFFTRARKNFSRIKEKLFPIIQRYLVFREEVLFFLLTKNKVISWIVLRWISVVLVYKYITQNTLINIPAEWFSIFMFFYGITCVGSHHELFLIVPMISIMRFESSCIFITRFYQSRTELLQRQFPLTLTTRSVWWKIAAMAAWENIDRASRSAALHTVAVGASGVALWKFFDYRDTLKNSKERQIDRDAEDKRHREGLAVESKERQLDRDAEDRRHKEILAAESKERQLDRDAENKRHAESLAAENKERQQKLDESNITDVD